MGLRELRKAKRLTQEDLETLTGVSQTTISGLENGVLHRPGWDIVGRLARALKCRPEDIVPLTDVTDR